MGDAKLVECDNGLFNTVTHFFVFYDLTTSFDPFAIMKANLALMDLQESANTVYA